MKAKTAEEIVKEFLKENDWAQENGVYQYMSYNGVHRFDAQPVLEDLLEYASQFREPSIAEQPGEQDVEVEWFKQCAKAEERIQELEQEIEKLKGFLVLANNNTKRRGERIKVLEDALRLHDPWPLHDVISKLVDGADILLHVKDYDAHGWEEYEHAFIIGKQIIESLKAITPSQPKDV